MKVGRRTVSSDEARRFPRVARSIRVHARLAKNIKFDQLTDTLNVGLGGVCINTYRTLPVGAPIELTFKGIGPDNGFDVHGRVAWSRQETAGQGCRTGIEILGLKRLVLERLLTLTTAGEWSPGSDFAPHHFHLRRHLGIEYRGTGVLLRRTWRKAYTDEISMRDVIVHTESSIRARSAVEIRLMLADGLETPLVCRGKVRQVRPGPRRKHWVSTIAFDDMGEPQAVRLAVFLSREFLPPAVLPKQA